MDATELPGPGGGAAAGAARARARVRGAAPRARRDHEGLPGAGLLRMLQPQRWGGFELDPWAFFEAVMEVASACASSAWVLGVVGVHNWQLALFPEQAQREVWGDDSSVQISSSYAPTGQGRARRRRLPARGPLVVLERLRPLPVGVPRRCRARATGRPPDMRTFLVPRSDYRIDDNWHVAGLSGTGSKDIVVEGAFVPEHRTHRFIDGFKLQSPGHAVNPAPLYRLPFGWCSSSRDRGAGDRRRAGRARRCSRAQTRSACARGRRREGRRRSVRAGAASPTRRRRSTRRARRCAATGASCMALAEAGAGIPLAPRVRTRFDAAQRRRARRRTPSTACSRRAAGARSSSTTRSSASSATCTRCARTRQQPRQGRAPVRPLRARARRAAERRPATSSSESRKGDSHDPRPTARLSRPRGRATSPRGSASPSTCSASRPRARGADGSLALRMDEHEQRIVLHPGPRRRPRVPRLRGRERRRARGARRAAGRARASRSARASPRRPRRAASRACSSSADPSGIPVELYVRRGARAGAVPLEPDRLGLRHRRRGPRPRGDLREGPRGARALLPRAARHAAQRPREASR